MKHDYVSENRNNWRVINSVLVITQFIIQEQISTPTTNSHNQIRLWTNQLTGTDGTLNQPVCKDKKGKHEWVFKPWTIYQTQQQTAGEDQPACTQGRGTYQHACRGKAPIGLYTGERHQRHAHRREPPACTQGEDPTSINAGGKLPPSCTQGGTPMSMYWYSEPACLQQTKGDTWVSWLTLYYFTDLYLRRLSILPPTKQKTHLQQTCNNKWLCQNSMQQIIETSEEQSHV